MDTGISIYPGLRGSIREKTGLIEEAAALGIHRLFTSFHIPETDAAAFHEELDAVLASARENSMDVAPTYRRPQPRFWEWTALNR